jgi:hypothetical protein
MPKTNKSEISNPIDNSTLLTDAVLAQRVQQMLEPIINKFEKDHRGKEITNSDIEGLYTNLSDNLSKDPRIGARMFVDTNNALISNNNIVLKEMAGNIANEIQQGHKVSTRDKLIRGFSDYCSNHGLEAIGAACLKLITKDTNLINQLDRIAKDVASTKTSMQVGNRESAAVATPIANPKIGGDRGR